MSVFKTIVVGTDGSDRAEEAVEEAAAIAKATGANAHVVRAVSGPGGDPEGEGERAAEILRGEGVSEVETHVIRDDPSEALINAAEEHGADLIVVGNKGMTGAQRFLLGSVPNDVGHHANCSVLIARTG
jgi:nucleotide-binding universal stress UspA family protein